MSELIGILGDSGKGKTTSLRNLDPEETVIINVSGKPLPFRGWKSDYTKGIKEDGNYVETNNAQKIEKILKYIHSEREEIKNVVIDDMQYVQAFEFFKRRDEKNYQKFNDIGGHLFDVLNTGRNLREDLKVITTFHPDENGEGLDKKKVFKTLGKMVRQNLTPEGLYTVIFWSDYDPQDDEYYFETETDGTTPARSPMGMFEQRRIPNDLDAALNTIDEYYQG
jgi:hypothetical protein